MRWLTTGILVGILAAAGCDSTGDQPPFPELVAVTGTITQGKPVSGGSVVFAPEPNKGEFLINSEVGTDGTYKLSTVRTTDKRGERRTGAPAGTYKVTYNPPMADQTTGMVEPITLTEPYAIGTKDQQVNLQLPVAKKK